MGCFIDDKVELKNGNNCPSSTRIGDSLPKTFRSRVGSLNDLTLLIISLPVPMRSSFKAVHMSLLKTAYASDNAFRPVR